MLEAAPFMSTIARTPAADVTVEVETPVTPASPVPTTMTAAAGPDATPGMLLVALLFFGGLAAVVSGVAYVLGAFRRGVADGPVRVPADRPVWTTAVTLLGAVTVFLTVLAVVAVVARVGGATSGGAGPTSPDEMVVMMKLTAAAYAAAIATALGLHAVARRFRMAGSIGVAPSHLPRGVVAGLIAVPVILAWTFAAGIALQLVRYGLGLPTDSIHEVLKAMRDDPTSSTLIWGVITSVVVAPLTEEILFRGFLQTSLVYGLPRLFGSADRVPSGPEAEPVPPDAYAFAPADPDEPLRYRPADVTAVEAVPVEAGPSARWRWLGIVLSAAVFTSLHEPWSWPIIFLLGIGFGYVYERTGSLYASMIVHFAFNGMNVTFLLLSLRGG